MISVSNLARNKSIDPQFPRITRQHSNDVGSLCRNWFNIGI